MGTKTCIKCGETKLLVQFYRHAGMANGRLGKCKVCCRADAIANRQKFIERYRAYDRERGSRLTAANLRAYREKNPEKNKARQKVSYALKSGKLTKAPCVICGSEKAHAHHDNYDRPLDVTWLCAVHHKERHKSLGWGYVGNAAA